MHHGEIPDGMFIDHIDHDRDNNRIQNLRLSDHKINGKNCKLFSSNTSGYTGIRWEQKRNKWKADIKVDGKKITLGRYVRLEDAIKARKQAELKYGFHENHGR